MRIPEAKIDEILRGADIVDTIGAFVQLKKRGKSYIGLCPFHQEKSPSFNVSQDRQVYHCFGCGAGGNVFSFLMQHEKISFVEAVRWLAEKQGIVLEGPEGSTEEAGLQEELHAACKMAARFFRTSMTSTTEGKLAHSYFQIRGFKEETIRLFGLGFAPNSWDALVQTATVEGISASTLLAAGLARKREDGSYYDYFRGRAMFPIFSPAGRVIGFGARKLLEDDPLGKYINSPETPIYNKSRLLYGLYQAKDDIRSRDSAILVEGYADLISVFQAGTRNVVASSGTALTVEQIRLLGRYTRNVVIVYDSDSAGSQATLRGVDLLLEQGLDVRVAELPAGDDPDSFVQKHGGSAFEQLVSNAVSFIEYLASSHERAGRLTTPAGQAEMVRALVTSISKISDELKRNFYIKHVAEKYKLYESMLYRELERIRKNPALAPDRPVAGLAGDVRAKSGRDIAGSPSEKVSIDVSQVERDLLRAMIQGGLELIKTVFEHISPEDFRHQTSRSIAFRLYSLIENGGALDVSTMVNEVTDEDERRLLSDLSMPKHHLSQKWNRRGVPPPQADPDRIAVHAILTMKRRAVEALIEENQRMLKSASMNGEDVVSFLERHQQLIEEIQSLDSLKKLRDDQ